MDLKVLFLIVTTGAVVYKSEVNINDERFSAVAARNISIDRRNLFEFVTRTHLVDRWMNWIPIFAVGNQRPLGVGRIYKVISGNDAILFEVTQFNDGNYIAMESNFLLRPRVEVRFIEVDLDGSHDGGCIRHVEEDVLVKTLRRNTQLEIRLTFRRASAVFQYTIGALIRKTFEEHLIRSLEILDKIITNPNNDLPQLFD